MLQYEYARSALKLGLKLEKQIGVNPYKFGMIGSTDAHTSFATADSDNFFGKLPAYEPSPDRWKHASGFANGKAYIGWEFVSSGYAGVWAADNTREEPRSDNISYADVARDFGGKFAAALQKLPIGEWRGPIESGFGLHLVFLSKRTEGRVPELDEVREVVRREWANDFRVETDEKFYQSLLNRYTVIVERPESTSGNKTAAQAIRP
jgi:hypothetical protein